MMSSPSITTNGSSPDVLAGHRHGVAEARAPRPGARSGCRPGRRGPRTSLSWSCLPAASSATSSSIERSKWSSRLRLPRPVMMRMSSMPARTASSTTYWMAGLVDDRQHLLGLRLGGGEEAGAEPRRRDDGLAHSPGHRRSSPVIGRVLSSNRSRCRRPAHRGSCAKNRSHPGRGVQQRSPNATRCSPARSQSALGPAADPDDVLAVPDDDQGRRRRQRRHLGAGRAERRGRHGQHDGGHDRAERRRPADGDARPRTRPPRRGPAAGNSTTAIPAPVATPLPPRNPRVTGSTWPTTAASPQATPSPWPPTAQPTAAGTAPLSTSPTSAAAPARRPGDPQHVRGARVARPRPGGVDAPPPGDEDRGRERADEVRGRHEEHGPAGGDGRGEDGHGDRMVRRSRGCARLACPG